MGGLEPGSGPSSDLVFCVTLGTYLPFSEPQFPQMSKVGRRREKLIFISANSLGWAEAVVASSNLSGERN